MDVYPFTLLAVVDILERVSSISVVASIMPCLFIDRLFILVYLDNIIFYFIILAREIASFWSGGTGVKDDMGMCPLHLALLRSHLDEGDEVEGENKGNARFEGGNDEKNNARTIRKREEDNSNNTKDRYGEENEEELNVETLRLLLGQAVSPRHGGKGKGGTGRIVLDGRMRKGEHLKMDPGKIGTGAFGESQSSKALKRVRDKSWGSIGSYTGQKLSRGFGRARDSESNGKRNGENSYDDDPTYDPDDHNPLRSPLLTLWEGEDTEGEEEKEGDRKETHSPRGTKYLEVLVEEGEIIDNEVRSYLRHLIQWKRKRRRGNDGKGGGKGINNTKTDWREKLKKMATGLNPAAVQASSYKRLPLHMAIRRQTHIDGQQRRWDRGSNPNDIYRILVHAHPLSLMIKDLPHGWTPLMTFLELSSLSPSNSIETTFTSVATLTTVELLLGLRTAGFKSAPDWLPEASDSNISWKPRLLNPAMVAVEEGTGCLPLHVAAGDPSLDPDVIRAIYACHPAARHIQDNLGRTPLHHALKGIVSAGWTDEGRKFHQRGVHPTIVGMLLDEVSARIADHLGRYAFDYLAEYSGMWLPPLRGDGGGVYRLIFNNTVVGQGVAGSGIKLPAAECTILGKIYQMPPWLRREACAAESVQKILIYRVAYPGTMALVFAYGATLAMLVYSFLRYLDEHVSSPSSSSSTGMNKILTKWYKDVIIVCIIFLFIYEVCFFIAACRLRVAWRQCFTNIWSWITISGLVTTIVSTLLIDRDVDSNNHALNISIATIGLLWAMVIGYFAKWCFRVNVFCSGVIEVGILQLSLFNPRFFLFIALRIRVRQIFKICCILLLLLPAS